MLSINPSELIWTILGFFALLFLLNRFLYRPLIRFMDARQARIDEGLNEQRQAQEALDEDAQALEQFRQEKLQEARREILAEKSLDEERRAQALLEAKQSAAEADRRGRSEAEELCASAEREIELRRDELAEKLAQRLLEAGNTEQ